MTLDNVKFIPGQILPAAQMNKIVSGISEMGNELSSYVAEKYYKTTSKAINRTGTAVQTVQLDHDEDYDPYHTTVKLSSALSGADITILLKSGDTTIAEWKSDPSKTYSVNDVIIDAYMGEGEAYVITGYTTSATTVNLLAELKSRKVVSVLDKIGSGGGGMSEEQYNAIAKKDDTNAILDYLKGLGLDGGKKNAYILPDSCALPSFKLDAMTFEELSETTYVGIIYNPSTTSATITYYTPQMSGCHTFYPFEYTIGSTYKLSNPLSTGGVVECIITGVGSDIYFNDDGTIDTTMSTGLKYEFAHKDTYYTLTKFNMVNLHAPNTTLYQIPCAIYKRVDPENIETETDEIKFTIAGIEYTAERGMTWANFVTSEYNVEKTIDGRTGIKVASFANCMFFYDSTNQQAKWIYYHNASSEDMTDQTKTQQASYRIENKEPYIVTEWR